MTVRASKKGSVPSYSWMKSECGKSGLCKGWSDGGLRQPSGGDEWWNGGKNVWQSSM